MVFGRVFLFRALFGVSVIVCGIVWILVCRLLICGGFLLLLLRRWFRWLFVLCRCRLFSGNVDLCYFVWAWGGRIGGGAWTDATSFTRPP